MLPFPLELLRVHTSAFLVIFLEVERHLGVVLTLVGVKCCRKLLQCWIKEIRKTTASSAGCPVVLGGETLAGGAAADQ